MVHGNYTVKRKSRGVPPIIVQGLLNEYYLNGVLQASDPVLNFKIREVVETLAYSTKPKGKRYLANFCTHYRYSYELVGGVNVCTGTYTPPSPDWTFFNRTNNYYVASSASTIMADAKSALGITGHGYLGVNGQGLINDAFAKLRPDLTTISIPNFLLELKDIPKLWRTWKEKLGLLRRLADQRLAYKYGLQPLKSDIQTMRDIIGSVYEKCREWNRKAGAIEHRRYTAEPIHQTANGTYGYPSGGHTVYWNARQDAYPSAHLTFQTEAIAALETMEVVLRAYLDALGFELNPRILWDALPFSFVLDWFFDVGGWCDRFKMDTLELPIVLVDAFCQYKEDIMVESYWLRANDGTHSPRPRSGSLVQDEHLFSRLPIFPDLSAATAQGWRMPNTNQLVNAISLAVALS